MQLEILKLELQKANEKVTRLEEHNAKLVSATEAPVSQGETTVKPSSSAAADLRLSEMRFEKGKLEAQLQVGLC